MWPLQPLILDKGLVFPHQCQLFNFKFHLGKTQWKNLNSPSSSRFHWAINLSTSSKPEFHGKGNFTDSRSEINLMFINFVKVSSSVLKHNIKIEAPARVQHLILNPISPASNCQVLKTMSPELLKQSSFIPLDLDSVVQPLPLPPPPPLPEEPFC